MAFDNLLLGLHDAARNAQRRRDVADMLAPDYQPPKVDTARIEAAVREILAAIGEDVSRDGIADTPARVAKWWREFIEYHPGKIETQFASESSGQVVRVTGMRVWSLCEHHLLPFWCDVSVSYVPAGRIIGLSKFARMARLAAHRPNVQERLVALVADMVEQAAGTADVLVQARGEHLCMTARGIRTPAIMETSEARGVFRHSHGPAKVAGCSCCAD